MMATRQEGFLSFLKRQLQLPTGLDQELVHRFGVILQAITSCENIDVENFRLYTRATAERCGVVWLVLYVSHSA
jgi:hypothetical protein